MKVTHKYECPLCKATKEIVDDTERTGQPLQTPPDELICGVRGCEGVMPRKPLHFDPEVNFTTHPFLDNLVLQFEQDPHLIYTIVKQDRPIAVVISPVLLDRLKEGY